MNIITNQRKLEELSKIDYQVNIGKSNEVSYLEIMILKLIVGERGVGYFAAS
ncbi:hypothetical protein [Cytobacillus praedii]|uniref:hypothetical protein n=1 Tax=Cytobacillus praedii TaxID=1742358 RepID=UPI002E20E5BA|nr:hypothetical protein [Cytobacillus praedii]